MDAFYASVEQRDRPELRGRPVIVGATSARGVVAAASYEARRFGVRSAMPAFQARKLCPEGIFLPGDHEKYGRVSRQIHQVFAEFTDCIEPLALDEAFLDMTGSVHLWGSIERLARELKRRVLAQTGLVVSIGVGPNKLVAKIACALGKPDGLSIVSAAEAAQFLAPLPIRRLWGIGPHTEQILLQAGVQTCGELAQVPLGRLRALVGQRAFSFSNHARGLDDRPVESEQAPQSIGEESTFERDLSDSAEIESILGALSEDVARRLRAGGQQASTIHLKIKLARRAGQQRGRNGELGEPVYPLLTRSATLSHSTTDGALIRRVVLQLWQRAQIREKVRLLGVSVSKLRAAQSAQLDLFAPRSLLAPQAVPAYDGEERGRALGAALDAITERFGSGVVRRGAPSPKKLIQGDRIKWGEKEPD